MEIWIYGNKEIRKYGNMEIWIFGNMEIGKYLNNLAHFNFRHFKGYFWSLLNFKEF